VGTPVWYADRPGSRPQPDRRAARPMAGPMVLDQDLARRVVAKSPRIVDLRITI
jgi:hypothetical protein